MAGKYKIPAVLLLLATFVFGACKKEGDRANWNVDALLPLFEASLTLGDIIPDSLISYDENELVYLSFNDTIFRFELDTLVQLPDTSFLEEFNWPIELSVPPGTQISNIQDEQELQSNDIELRRVRLQEGTIEVVVNSTFPGAILCTYTIPDATLNGVPLEVEGLVPAASDGNPGQFSLLVDVSGYEIALTNGSEPFNRMRTSLSVRTDPDGEEINLSPGQGFDLTTYFSGIVPEFAEGYFGQQINESDPEIQEFDAFEIIEGGTIDLEAVNVNFEIRNGLGVDIRANILALNALRTDLGTSIGINHPIIGSPVNLNRATRNGNEVNYSSYEVTFDENNSSIAEMLESFPNAFEAAAILELNPLGNVSNHYDFAFASSTIDGVLSVEIPLCLIAEELQLSDTSAFDVSDDEFFNGVNSGTIVLQVQNGFPLNGIIDLIALNSEGIQTLLGDGAFQSGTTNADNEVISPYYSELVISLDEEGVEKLRLADELVIKARFSTSGISQYVKMYSHYTLDVKAIADFNYHVNH